MRTSKTMVSWSVALAALHCTLLLHINIAAAQQQQQQEAPGAPISSNLTVGVNEGLCQLFVDPLGTYSCGEYYAGTDDGFNLGVQRIRTIIEMPTVYRQPVFLMHGVLQGGQNWLLNPPVESLPFILADYGFDVWIGNGRGTLYSHGHERYTVKDKEYWDWSVDELASKDLVAMLNMVHVNTNYKKIHYVGFSQGTQAAFAALSQGLLADVLDRIVMVGPVAFVEYTSCKPAQLAMLFHIDSLLEKMKIYSYGPTTNDGRQLVSMLCGSNGGCYEIWSNALSGHNCCINASRAAYYEKYEPQPTSVKNLKHLAQGYRQGTFAWYDYGKEENLLRYKSETAPAYDLSKVPTSNMLLIHGKRDALSDTKDVEKLKKLLTPGFQTKLIESYAHKDFTLGYNANQLVYPDIVNFIAGREIIVKKRN